MHVGIFSLNHYKSVVWGYLTFSTNEAEVANGWTQAPHHHHAELAEGKNIYYDGPNYMTWFVIYDMYYLCTSTYEQANI